MSGGGALRGRRLRRLAVFAFAALVTSGCGGSTRHFGPVQRTASPVIRMLDGPPAHVAVIVMENEEYGDIIGSPATPYINALAKRYALAREMFAVSHPSLPNYLALTGGSTFGVDSDCTDCRLRAPGLGAQLNAGTSWKAYMEDLPHPCFSGTDAGGYAQKHNPFAYFGDRGASCSHVVPLRELAADERSGRLPRFIWITPNLCHDMHDCSLTTGDHFLAGLVAPLLRSLGRDGVLFLTWDEGSSDQGCCRLASGGHVATIVAGPGARSGARLSTPADHYSTLQAIEDLLALPRLRGAACACTPSLGPLLRVRRVGTG